MFCLLEAIRERETGHLEGPPRPSLARLRAHPAIVPSRLIVTFQPLLATDCPLPGGFKLQETNKTSPNEWMALR